MKVQVAICLGLFISLPAVGAEKDGPKPRSPLAEVSSQEQEHIQRFSDSQREFEEVCSVLSSHQVTWFFAGSKENVIRSGKTVPASVAEQIADFLKRHALTSASNADGLIHFVSGVSACPSSYFVSWGFLRVPDSSQPPTDGRIVGDLAASPYDDGKTTFYRMLDHRWYLFRRTHELNATLVTPTTRTP